MLGDFDEVLVMDWGLAERQGDENAGDKRQALVGTPAYMAPEMANAELDRINEMTDVYLLGACLYQLLTNKPPHDGGGKIRECLFCCWP